MIDENRLPQGWETTTLKEITSSVKGKKPKILSQIKTNALIPYIDIKAFEKNEINQYADSTSSKLANKDDVLIVWDGARSGLVGIGQEGAIGSTILALKPILINSIYLFRFLQTQYDIINRNTRGTGIPHVDPEIFWNIQFPLPPLNEQRRIVSKLEKLLSKVEFCKDRLKKIPLILKRFRQSVLASACSGRLTADWREKHPDVEPAIDLIERIHEKMKKYYEKINKKKKLKLSNDYLVNNSKLPIIPESWVYSHLQYLGELTRGRSKHRPRNAPHLLGGKYPFIQTGDVAKSGGKIRNHSQTYSELGLAQSRLFPEDTLCITIAANIADTGVLTYPACFPDSIVGFIPEKGMFEVLFAMYFMQIIKSDLQMFAPATAQKNINLQILYDVAIPVPPLAEQKEIVYRVESLFKLADAIEARYEKAKKYIEKLSQSILSKAFRGELVPHDPSDEPASVLLERIRKERAGEIPKNIKNRLSTR